MVLIIIFAVVILLRHELAQLVLKLFLLLINNFIFILAIVTLHVLILGHLVWSHTVRHALVDALVMICLLVLLLLVLVLLVHVNWHLAVVLHINLIYVTHLLLLLDHVVLELLLLVQHVHSTVFANSWGNAAGEIGKLIQLIEILGSLEQDLLIVIKVIIWVNICVS